MADESTLERFVLPAAPDGGVPEWWERLWQASNSSIFLSEPWLRTWLEVYGRDFEAWWICWRAGGDVVGGCLVATRSTKRSGIPLRSLYFNASGEALERTPLSEFNDILCIRGYEEAIVADCYRALESMSWDRLLVHGYLPDGLLARLVARYPEALVLRDPRLVPHVDLVALGTNSYESTLGSNARQQIRRSQRLYTARSGDVSMSVASSIDEALLYLDELAVLHNARWSSRGQPGSFASPAYFEFHRRLVPRLWPRGSVQMIRVSAGQEPIGYLYNFSAFGKVYYFQSGFVYQLDPKLKPGLLSHALAIEYYRARNFGDYDFLTGDARYKRSLAKGLRTLCWSGVYRDRPSMRFLLWIRGLSQRFRRKSEADPSASGSEGDA